MEIRVGRRGELAVLHLSGELTAGRPGVLLLKGIGECLEQGCSRFLLDLSEVHYLNSSGIGVLVRAYQFVISRNGDLCAIGAQPQVMAALDSIGSHPLFGRNAGELLHAWGVMRRTPGTPQAAGGR